MRLTLNVARQTVALALGAIVLVACGSAGSDEPAGLESTPSKESAPSTTAPSSEDTSSNEAEIAELEALHRAYWNAFIEASNGPTVDAALFEGIATTGVIERRLGYVQTELVGRNARRQGEPSISNVTVTVDGDQARIEACVDSSGWKLIVEGTEIPTESSGPVPSAMTANRTSDGWIINKVLTTSDAEITC